MEELMLQIEGKSMRRFCCIGYGEWAERQRYVRGRISRHVGRAIHLPRRQTVDFSVRGIGRMRVALKLDVETRLSDIARWFGINSGFDSESYLQLVTKHLRARIEEIAEEATRGDKGIWTDRAIAAVQSIDPDNTFFLPGKIYRVASLEILPPTKLALALADEQ